MTTNTCLLQVKVYVEAALRKSDLERTELQKVKTGVFTGTYARNPATAEAIPVWVADYVLGRWVWLQSSLLIWFNWYGPPDSHHNTLKF